MYEKKKKWVNEVFCFINEYLPNITHKNNIFAFTYKAPPRLFIELISFKFYCTSDVGQGKLQRLGYLFSLPSSHIASFSQMQLLFNL